jgi:hypothetical protein
VDPSVPLPLAHLHFAATVAETDFVHQAVDQEDAAAARLPFTPTRP